MSNNRDEVGSGIGAIVIVIASVFVLGLVGLGFRSFFGRGYQQLQTDVVQGSEDRQEGVINRVTLYLESYCKAAAKTPQDTKTMNSQRQLIQLDTQTIPSKDSLGAVGTPVRDAVEALDKGEQVNCTQF